jgi:membrane protein YqaA with SNARE-associated domain
MKKVFLKFIKKKEVFEKSQYVYLSDKYRGMNNLIKRLHAWSLQWANTKWGTWTLFICAFADALVLPLPTPMFFLALALLNIKNAYKYALFGTFGILSGALAGYAIGHFALLNTNGEFTGLAHFLFNNIPGFSEDSYNKIHILYEKWDFGILFIAAFLPLHFNIFSISSGVFDINIPIFCVSTLIGQGIKFYLLALLTIKLGPEVKKLFSFNWKPIAIIATACIVLAIVAIKVF